MEEKKKKFSFDGFYDKWGVYVTLILLIIVLTCLAGTSFFSLTNLQNVLRQGAIYMILAFGVTFVFISGGIDLSVGQNICFSSCVFALLTVDGGVNIWPALFITIAIGAVIGAANAFCIDVLKINPFLATLGMMYILKGLAAYITDEVAITGIPTEAKIFGGYIDFWVPAQVIIAAIVFVILFITLNHTKMGRYCFAVGSNEVSAKMSGVNVRKVKFFAFMICGACAALCGVILCARMKMGSYQICSGYEMDAIAAVCIGGTSSGGGRGSLVKTIAGSLTLTIIRNGLNILGLSSSLQNIIIGLIIIIVVAMDMRQQRKIANGQ